MPGPARVVLLDVMDCLVHDPFYDEVLAFFGVSLEAHFAVKSKSAWTAFECGQLSEDEFRRRYYSDGRPLDLAGLKAVMRANYRLRPGIADLLDDLRVAGHELHALSNYPRWYQLIEAATSLSRWLRWSFVSCKTQRRKPDASTYLSACATLGRAPHTCLFIDDRSKNCDAAAACGLPTILATSSPQIREALTRTHWLPGA